jgi:putative NADPH-quinone reductase
MVKGAVMKVLVVDAFAEDQAGRALVDAAVETLAVNGNAVDRLDLRGSGFPVFMTEEERRRYHDADNICCPHVQDSVDRVRDAEAVLFGYPTTMFTIPSHLKGWLERTMLPGVAFVLNEKHQVRPGLPEIRRVGAVTTTPHDRRAMRMAGDNGKRTLMRSFRGNCAKVCRRTFVSIHDADIPRADPEVRRAFRQW